MMAVSSGMADSASIEFMAKIRRLRTMCRIILIKIGGGVLPSQFVQRIASNRGEQAVANNELYGSFDRRAKRY